MIRLNGLFDFFIPRQCPGCNNKLLSNETAICRECLASIKFSDNERLKTEFERKFLSTKIISGFTSLFVFENVHRFQVHK